MLTEKSSKDTTSTQEEVASERKKKNAEARAARRALRKNKRDEFLTIENDFRKQTNLPPYGRFVSIIISSKDMNLLERFTSSLKKSAPNFENVIILGPAPAPITFLRGKFRYRFLIKSSREINIQKVIRNWLKNIKIPSNVKLTVDIEPYSFL